MTDWAEERYGSESAASFLASRIDRVSQALVDARADDAPKVSLITLVDTYDADGEPCGSMVVTTNDPRSQHPMFLVRMIEEGLKQAVQLAWDGTTLRDEDGDPVHIPWNAKEDDDAST